MQIGAYARVSTQRQAQLQSAEQQIERLLAHATGQGWSLVPDGVFRDDGYSGATLRRPGLDRLRDTAARVRLDRILITAPDRLARNYVHQVLLVEALEKHGAEVVFLDRLMSRDPHDQLLLQIRSAVAKYERTLISERMRRGRPTATGSTPSGRATRRARGWTRRKPRSCATCSPGSPTRVPPCLP